MQRKSDSSQNFEEHFTMGPSEGSYKSHMTSPTWDPSQGEALRPDTITDVCAYRQEPSMAVL